MSVSPLGRVVEIAENGRHLAREDGFLVILTGRAEIGRVPLDDIAAVIATAPGTSMSCAILAELSARGVPFVICGANYLPASIIWPVAGHHAQQRRMECQIDAGQPLKKRLWAMIVAAKIRQQGAVLGHFGKNDDGFAFLSRSVRSGDPENVEAQAARRYWPLLFGDQFRRDQASGGVNAMLNYGYAVLRAGTARAIVAAGLHPGLGIFHRHPHNPMPLADDLMEPFRPYVDQIVVRMIGEDISGVSVQVKRRLAAVLNIDMVTKFGTTPLGTCLIRLAASVADSYITASPDLDLPLPLIAIEDPKSDGALI